MTLLTTLLERPEVTRVWPGKRGSLTFEWYDEHGRLCAGELDRDARMRLLAHGTDPALPGLGADLPGAIVVHRYGRRAVAVGTDRVVKYTRAGHAPAIVANAAGFASLCDRAGIHTPQVLHHDEARIDFERSPGHSLMRRTARRYGFNPTIMPSEKIYSEPSWKKPYPNNKPFTGRLPSCLPNTAGYGCR